MILQVGGGGGYFGWADLKVIFKKVIEGYFLNCFF